jgi:hypothetical protein
VGITVAMGALGCVTGPLLMNWTSARLPAEWVFPFFALPLALAVVLLLLPFRKSLVGGTRRVVGSDD